MNSDQFQQFFILYYSYYLLDCFVPRNDGYTYRHCEMVIERSRNTRSNPDIYNL